MKYRPNIPPPESFNNIFAFINFWFEHVVLMRWLGGHLSIGNITIYGYNAMHFAINIRSKKYGFICFKPPTKCFGNYQPWYFYLSPDATPRSSTFCLNIPQDRQKDKYELVAKDRLKLYGHNFDREKIYP